MDTKDKTHSELMELSDKTFRTIFKAEVKVYGIPSIKTFEDLVRAVLFMKFPDFHKKLKGLLAEHGAVITKDGYLAIDICNGWMLFVLALIPHHFRKKYFEVSPFLIKDKRVVYLNGKTRRVFVFHTDILNMG